MASSAPPRAAEVRAKLLAWYDAHRRDLPWRRDRDPYCVWLSEIMLQQTTVAHATPYFLAFTARWPTVADLAGAADSELMAAWAGLGYYARARNLLACARTVAEKHGGVFPRTEAELRALPGIGAYTAAAIAAIAFGRAANVVDGNVERVIARLFAVETPLPGAKGELARLAEAFVRPQRAADWPQALMDLGAGVCTPKSPDCRGCPLTQHCLARIGGAPGTYPRRSARAIRPHRHGAAFVLTCNGDVALQTRPPRGLLGGMLGLPTTPWRAAPWPGSESLSAAPAPGVWRRAGEVDHVFTHFSLKLTIYTAELACPAPGFAWTPLAEAADSLPSLFRKALEVTAGG
jgi:A/G-specific adenine glycosylase